MALKIDFRALGETLGLVDSREDKIAAFEKQFPNVFEQIADAPDRIEAAKLVGKAFRVASKDPQTERFFVQGIKQIAPLINEARETRKLRTFTDEARDTLDEAGAAVRAQTAGFRPPGPTQVPTKEDIAGGTFTPLRKLGDPIRPQDSRKIQLAATRLGFAKPEDLASNLTPEASVTVGGQKGNVPFAELFQQSQQTGRSQIAQKGQTERTQISQQGALERAQLQREGALERLEKNLGSKEALTELTETGKTERAKLKADEARGLKSTLGTLTGSLITLMRLQDNPNADDALINNTQVLIDAFLVKASKLDPTIRIEVDPQSGRRVLMRGEQPVVEELPPEEIPAEAEKSGLTAIPLIGDALANVGDALVNVFGGGATPSAATQPIQQTNIQEASLPATQQGLAPETQQVEQESEEQLRQQLQVLMDQLFEATGDEALSRQILEESFDEAGGDPNTTAQLVQRRLGQLSTR